LPRRPQAGVALSLLHQLVVRGDLDESSVFENRNTVGPLRRRQAVRNGDHGSAFGNGGERSFDRNLCRGIEARRRFVQDDYRRIRQCDPRETDELAFSRRETKAAGLTRSTAMSAVVCASAMIGNSRM
jgi:hypothetical protein